MGILEIFLIAISLSMDAFAIATCIGLSLNLKKSIIKPCLITGVYFGVFQGVMPIIGWFVGARFADKITNFDHWLTFAILFLIGAKMIKEALDKSENKEKNYSDLSAKKMLPLAIATSIDALAIGVTFAFKSVNIFSSALLIGVITFVLSAFGVKIGGFLGEKFKSKAELAGGFILILIGTKSLLEHLEVINF